MTVRTQQPQILEVPIIWAVDVIKYQSQRLALPHGIKTTDGTSILKDTVSN